MRARVTLAQQLTPTSEVPFRLPQRSATRRQALQTPREASKLALEQSQPPPQSPEYHIGDVIPLIKNVDANGNSLATLLTDKLFRVSSYYSTR